MYSLSSWYAFCFSVSLLSPTSSSPDQRELLTNVRTGPQWLPDRRVVKWANVITRSGGAFCTLALGYSGLDDASDQTTVPFHEGELIRETAFQDYTYSVVPG